MRTHVLFSLTLLLAGCGALNGPLAGRSIQIGGAFGEVGVSESRHRPQPLDVFLDCKARKNPGNCEAEARLAMAFSCTPDAMPASSYALCLRCVSRRDADDAECRKLAAGIVATPDTSISVGSSSSQTFRPDGTADPAGHPPVGPPPPLK